MESYIVKLNRTNEYFVVDFTFLNSIRNVSFTKEKSEASIFQPEGNIIKAPKGLLRIGETKCKEFDFYLYLSGITSEDVSIEIFDAPEQSLFSTREEMEIEATSELFSDNKKGPE